MNKSEQAVEMSNNYDNLGRMHGHPLRLAEISNDRVIDIFVGRGPNFRFKTNGGNNIPFFIFYCIIVIIYFLLNK